MPILLTENQVKMFPCEPFVRQFQPGFRRTAENIVPAEAHALAQHAVSRAYLLTRGVYVQLHEVRLRKGRAVSGVPDIHPPAAFQHARGLGKYRAPVLREEIHEEIKGRHGVEAAVWELKPPCVHADTLEIPRRVLQLIGAYVYRRHRAAVYAPDDALSPAAEVEYAAGDVPL